MRMLLNAKSINCSAILQQMLQDTMQWLAARSQQPPKQEGVLRIWMGNGKDNRILRQVYGPMANGKNRNDLTPERLRSLLNALQEPVTEGADPARYAKRNSAIEIKIDDVTLFRQERDGIITVNQIQQQIQNAPTQLQPSQLQVGASKVPDQALSSSEQVQRITTTSHGKPSRQKESRPAHPRRNCRTRRDRRTRSHLHPHQRNDRRSPELTKCQLSTVRSPILPALPLS